MRRLLAAIIFGLVLLVAAPAALAAEGDYPPEAGSSGVVRHDPAPGPAVDPQLAGEDSLAGTGSDVAGELGVGAGLILLGSTTLLLVRRRRGMARAR
jgi:hypothetical protein